MDTNNLIKVYYSQSSDFLEQLLKIYPNNTNIKKYREYLEITKKIKPRFIIEKYFEYVSPHKELLLSRDEKYFLDMTYDSSNGGDDSTMMYALDIKSLWSGSSAETKNIIFDYLILFYKMSEKILFDSLTDEQKRQLSL